MTVGPNETEIIIDSRLFNPILPHRETRTRVAILTQPAPTDIALRQARDLEASGLTVEVVGLPDREAAKTLEVASSVYEVLAKMGLGRHDTILGVGGGSVSDLAGFVAGTWMRGVESVLLPTTVLGAVDASIGGKTGINVAGKNLVGVFWHPTRVVIDTAQLSRLPSSLIRDGMAEIYKAGLVGNPELAVLISQNGIDTKLADVVPLAVSVKAEVVAADEREMGIRAYLNLGHTIGHALEFASTLTHGEAVALGMVSAARLSAQRLGFEHEAAVQHTLSELGLPTSTTGMNRERVIDLLHRDKKRDASGLRMVLLHDIGQPTLEHVTAEDIEEGLAAIGL